jgi:hypothetical protein
VYCIVYGTECSEGLKSGSLNLLEPSESVKACNGIALPCLSLNVSLTNESVFSYGTEGIHWNTPRHVIVSVSPFALSTNVLKVYHRPRV